MTDPFYHENNAIASWFLGPRAENADLIRKLYNETINHQEKSRQNYFSNDVPFIASSMKSSTEFKKNARHLQKRLNLLSDKLSQKTVPFWSPRYMGHMSMEQSIAGNLGYVAALQYNQNNVATEGSPLTTWLEIFVGKQLCEMLGFYIHWNPNENLDTIDNEIVENIPEIPPKIQGWGHITCDGSVANLESIWAARNLKFYPLSLRLAVEEGSLSFIGSSFEVELANGQKKLFKDFSTWELLNLKPVTVLDIPDRLYNEYGITPQFLQTALNDYNIQTVGKDYLEKKFKITKSIVYFATTTVHYSWPKGCAIVGIGSKNLKAVPVDNAARMDMNELDKLFKQCVQDKQAIYAVVAIMGSTEHGACDPLGDIIKLRDKYERNYGLSFVIHADAAWGGYFRSIFIKPPNSLSHRRRRKKEHDSVLPKLALNSYTEKHLDSIKHCDSVTIDPHKSGYIPYPAGGLCYRDQRMRYLNTWTSPVIIRPNEESIGIYGVEGSKSGAAPAAVWLSHDIIGLHQKGYGLLLGKVAFSCTKIYCHWATMSTKDDDFTVTPFNMLPAEKLFSPNHGEVEKQKKTIRELIVEKTDREIIENEAARDLIKQLGSDLTVNAFVCNFKVKVEENGKTVYKLNEDINEANYLNQRIYEKFSLTSSRDTNADKPLILTSTRFRQKDYGSCLTNFKNRIGLKGDQDLYVLVNVVSSPWAESEFLHELTKMFKSTLQDLVKLSVVRNTVKPDHHTFVIQGTDQLHFTHLPMFQMENKRQQVIITADIPQRIKNIYLRARRRDPSHIYFLGNQNKTTLDEITRNGQSFRGVIYKDFDPRNGEPIPWIKDFRVTNVRVLKKRHLATAFQDAGYPNDHVPFYIYGTERELHIDHMLLKSPSIKLSADCVKLELTSGSLTRGQKERGVVAHIIDVHERTMQPFLETKKLGNSFFFQEGCTFNVELHEDPVVSANKNGPGLNSTEKPFARGIIRLPSKKEGCLFIDSYFTNMDPTADKKR